MVGVVGMDGAPITAIGSLGAAGTTHGGAALGVGITRISTAGIRNPTHVASTAVISPETTIAAAFRVASVRCVQTMALLAIPQETLVE